MGAAAAAVASNKFATMLHNSNTPKIAIVLIYTLLEWILLALLLLDGLFSYSIAAFAAFFGLDPPCFLCSHALGRNSNASSSYRDILCDSHADEIAGLVYCSRHRNLASATRMCDDCSSSSSSKPLTSWMKKNEEEEEDGVRCCSCCSEVVESGFYSPLPLIFGEKFRERMFLDEKDGVNEGASVEQLLLLKLEDRLEKVEESDIDHSAVVVVPASCEEEEEEEEEEADCAISIGAEICNQEEEALNETMVKEVPLNDSNLARVFHYNLSVCPPELVAEVEEERVPETPTSVDSTFHALPTFERRGEFGMESKDGSVACETDGSVDILTTVDRLKEALKAESNALSSLYLELEEERSASAIAANQTMAMITRLQEEKAVVQMEAVQYQRMMEEQSEYDQEALQLLNELMMKREKELEAYRKKVLAYEAKERRRRRSMAARTNRRSDQNYSSGSNLSADESNVDLSSEDCEYNQNDDLSIGTDQGGAAKHLLTLDDSLADFEEERFSILEQLKALEEKLFSLDDDNDDDESKTINGVGHHFPEQNGHGLDSEYDESSSGDDLSIKGSVNGSKANGKFNHDAVVIVESEEDGSRDPLTKSPSPVHKKDHEKKLAIAEEVDHVYERLEAFEADREFMKQCLESLKKGDKGMDLLQEILQHLRGLRSVQIRVRNAGSSLSA